MNKKRDDLVFLEDILDSITIIENYLVDVADVEFENNTEKQDAVIRRVEIIGEAVKHLSKSIKESYPSIPWRAIAGMRDIVIHQYFGVSIGLIWRVATVDLPDLKEKIVQIIIKLKE